MGFPVTDISELGRVRRPKLPATETIVAAALQIHLDNIPAELRDMMFNGKPVYPTTLTVSSPAPARHGTLLHPLTSLTGIRVSPYDQGFLTSTGRYVSREEGHKIAVASGQPMIDHPSRIDGVLYSEDLW